MRSVEHPSVSLSSGEKCGGVQITYQATPTERKHNAEKTQASLQPSKQKGREHELGGAVVLLQTLAGNVSRLVVCVLGPELVILDFFLPIIFMMNRLIVHFMKCQKNVKNA